MKLFLLSAIKFMGYDTYSDFVVRAKSEESARKMCQVIGGDEVRYNNQFWIDPKLSTCAVLESDGLEEVICSSFHAG